MGLTDERLCDIVREDWDGQVPGNSGREAFEELYHRYFGLVRRLVSLMLGLSRRASQEAEDISCGVMMRLLEAIRDGQYTSSRPFLPYLKRTVRNAVFDYFRFRGRAIRESTDLEYVAELHPSPIEQLLDRAIAERVHQVLQALPDSYREVLQLRFMEGLSPTETEQRLGISNGALRGLIHRAKDLYREEHQRRFGEQ